MFSTEKYRQCRKCGESTVCTAMCVDLAAELVLGIEAEKQRRNEFMLGGYRNRQIRKCVEEKRRKRRK